MRRKKVKALYCMDKYTKLHPDLFKYWEQIQRDPGWEDFELLNKVLWDMEIPEEDTQEGDFGPASYGYFI